MSVEDEIIRAEIGQRDAVDLNAAIAAEIDDHIGAVLRHRGESVAKFATMALEM